MSPTAGYNPSTSINIYNCIDLLGKVELQSLQGEDRQHTSQTAIKSQISMIKALAYGNNYHRYRKSMDSFFNIPDQPSSQINPLYFGKIEWGAYKFSLKNKLGVEINFSEGMWEAENKELDIFIVADDINELKEAFQEEFFVMWQVYSHESDEHLTTKARKIKENIIGVITGVEVGCH